MEVNKKSGNYFNSTSLVFAFLFVNFFILVPILFFYSNSTQEQEKRLGMEIHQEIEALSLLRQQENKKPDENNELILNKEPIENIEQIENNEQIENKEQIVNNEPIVNNERFEIKEQDALNENKDIIEPDESKIRMSRRNSFVIDLFKTQHEKRKIYLINKNSFNN